MVKSLSEQLVAKTVDTVLNGRRDVFNTDLEPFFRRAASTSLTDTVTRVQAAQAFRSENQLPTLATAQLSLQIAEPLSRKTFTQLLKSVGIEPEFTNDLIEVAMEGTVPVTGSPSSFAETAQTSGVTLSVSQIQAELATIEAVKNGLATPSVTKHIIQEPTVVQPDEDSRVLQGNAQIHTYTRIVLSTDV